MNAPRIQYAKTSDGVSIAFWSLGEGPPVIMVPPIPWSHLQSEWDDPGYRSFFERVGRGHQFIRYDSRGSGLSEHTTDLMDRESFELDIDAVAGRLGLDRFVLVGVSPGAPVAIGYAVRHPERVSQLVLWCPPWSTVDWTSPAQEAMRSLINSDWTLFTETIAHAMVAGWGSSDDARNFAKLMRDSVDHEALLLAESDIFQWQFDLSDILPLIRCPTLILQRREAIVPTMDSVRKLAAGIPGAQLVILDGGALLPWVGDMEAAARAIDEFLGVEPPPPAPQPSTAATRGGSFATILFTDVEGSTALTDRLGDAAAREVLREQSASPARRWQRTAAAR